MKFTLSKKRYRRRPNQTADRFFSEHMGIHKLLVVDDNDKLCGLYTLSDIERIIGEAGNHLKPAEIITSDYSAVLLFPSSLEDGKINQDELIQHVGEMVQQGSI